MKYLKVFTDFATTIEALSDAERGRLFVAMLKYAESGEAPDLRGGERILWSYAKQMIDKERAAYESICERNLRNATTRYHTLPVATSGIDTLQDKDKDNISLDKSKDSRTRKFKAPTKEDVAEYATTAGLKDCSSAFVDYYTANGWRTGKNKMVDWQAAYRGWVSRERDYAPKKRMGANAGYKQTMLSDDELSHLFVNLDEEVTQ